MANKVVVSQAIHECICRSIVSLAGGKKGLPLLSTSQKNPDRYLQSTNAITRCSLPLDERHCHTKGLINAQSWDDFRPRIHASE